MSLFIEPYDRYNVRTALSGVEDLSISIEAVFDMTKEYDVQLLTDLAGHILKCLKESKERESGHYISTISRMKRSTAAKQIENEKVLGS